MDERYFEKSPYAADGDCWIGKDPRQITLQDLYDLGHPTAPMKSIRARCKDCCGGNEAEVRKCTAIDCPIWPMRMSRNVFHQRSIDARRTHTK